MTAKDDIKSGLFELIHEARSRGKWLHCSYQDIWFSPDELETHIKDGRFVWGPINWTLRYPKEKLAQLKCHERNIRGAVESFKERMGP